MKVIGILDAVELWNLGRPCSCQASPTHAFLLVGVVAMGGALVMAVKLGAHLPM